MMSDHDLPVVVNPFNWRLPPQRPRRSPAVIPSTVTPSDGPAHLSSSPLRQGW